MRVNELSIIIPCYNEGAKVISNIEKINHFLFKNKISDFEIIVVNDGSSDNTKEVLNKFLDTHLIKELKYVGYDKNKGKGGAVKEGIKNSNGKWVLFMDADLSTDLNAILDVIKNKDKYDVIIGSRRHKDTVLAKKQNCIRRIIGKACSIITNMIIPLNLLDTQCGFKAFEGNFAREMINKQQLNGFAFDVEYLYISKLKNKKILEIGVTWENDEDSKVSVLKSSIRFFKDLLIIRGNKKIYKGE